MMQSESAATQPLCPKSNYNLRRVNGRSEVEFTVSEDEDPLKQDAEEDMVVISINEVDSSGNVVRSKVMEADKVPALPTGAVTVIDDDSQKK